MEHKSINNVELEHYARKCFIAYNPLLFDNLIHQRLTAINAMYDRSISHYIIDETGTLYNDCVSVENLAIQIAECKTALSKKVKRYNKLKRNIDRYLKECDDLQVREIKSYLRSCGQYPMTKAVIQLLTYIYERKEKAAMQQEASKQEAFNAWQEKQTAINKSG